MSLFRIIVLFAIILETRIQVLKEELPFELYEIQGWAVAYTLMFTGWSMTDHGEVPKAHIEIAIPRKIRNMKKRRPNKKSLRWFILNLTSVRNVLEHQIIKTGPYRWVRHPIYTSIITNVLGSAIVAQERRGLIAFVLVVVAYFIKIPKEENLLSKHFPQEYPMYKATTRKLVPFIF